LRKIKNPRAVDALIAALGDSYKTVLVKAISSLLLMEDDYPHMVVDAFIASMEDEDNDVRDNAALALSIITNKDFGEDSVKWQKWWDENKEAFPRAK